MNFGQALVTIIVSVIGSGALTAAAPKVVEAITARRRPVDPSVVADQSVARIDRSQAVMERNLAATERRAQAAEQSRDELQAEIAEMREDHKREIAQMREQHARELAEVRVELESLRAQMNPPPTR